MGAMNETKSCVLLVLLSLISMVGCTSAATPPPATATLASTNTPVPATSTPSPTSTPMKWKLVYEENFDEPFDEPEEWVEDAHGEESPYHVGPFDEDGDFFIESGGQRFLDELGKFRSFRKSYTYGEDGWLTVELYGRDFDKDGIPETGGQFISEDGKAKLISTRHYGGIRNWEKLRWMDPTMSA